MGCLNFFFWIEGIDVGFSLGGWDFDWSAISLVLHLVVVACLSLSSAMLFASVFQVLFHGQKSLGCLNLIYQACST